MIGGGTTDGNYLFTNDDEACEGKWIDMFMFQGISTDVEYRNHGVVAAASGSRYYGSGTNETVYAGCWETDTNNANPSTNGGIYISNGLSYTWKPLTYEEWEYILEERPGATVGDTDGWRFSRVTVAGIQGLLLFPDNLVWKTSGSKNVNDTDNTDLDAVAVAAGLPEDNCTVGETTYDFERSYSSEQWITMEKAGIVFIPSAGVIDDLKTYKSGFGRYWTGNAGGITGEAYILGFESTRIYFGGYKRNYCRCVRLARAYDPSEDED